MKSKVLIGGLIAGVISFLLGWLVFGIALKGYYTSNSAHYDNLIRVAPRIWALIIANFAWGFLLAWILDKAGANSAAKGFMCGLIIFFLVTLGVDMFTVAMMNMMRIRLALVDVAVSALFGGFNGAIVGWWYGRGNDPAA